jgi:hypothetical protein
LPRKECIPRRILRRTSIGISAWLLACGTERVELGPAPNPEPADPVEELAPPEEPRATVPRAVAFDVPSSNPRESSEGAARSLPLIASEIPERSSNFTDVLDTGCSKVDLLFVVDSSSSMRDRQTALALSFPSFLQVVQKTLGLADLHIMVVDTDGRAPSELLRDSPVVDDALCEKMRGAGIRLSETGSSCNFSTAQRFIVQDQPELEQTFACAAQVGIDGSDLEHPIDALLDALSPALNDPGGCNAGFLRDDAILFVTLISDEDDRHSAGDPVDWQTQLLARKGNNPGAIVTLGIVADGNLSGGLCRAVDDAPRLQSFAKAQGLIGSVCADDYSALFQQAVGWIAARCADFLPSAPR